MPVAAINLAARPARKGVSYSGATGRITNPHAFIATVKPKGKDKGKTAVFVRKGASRLPIKQVTVPVHDVALRLVRGLQTSFIPHKFREIFQAEFRFRTQRLIDKMKGQ
jgi:hypothetical protein